MRRSTRMRLAGLASIGAAASLAPASARADDVAWDNAKAMGVVAVRDRPRDGFTPEGIRFGNFVVLPDAGFRTYFRSDQQAGTPGRTNTMQYEATAALDIRSQMPRHFFELKVEGRGIADRDLGNVSYMSGSARMLGRYDIDHSMSLNAAATALVQQRSELPLDADRLKGAAQPYASATYGAEASFKRSVGRLDTTIGSRLTQFGALGSATADAALGDAHAGDYTTIEPFARVGWSLSPGRRVFSEVSAHFQHYSSDTGFNRDAQGYSVLGGVELEVSPLVKVMMKGGYYEQDFAAAGRNDLKTFVYEGHLDWYVSPLVTLGFTTKRDVAPSSYGTALGRIATSYMMRADYEMWRNLVFTAEAGMRFSDYIGEPRSDQWWTGKIGFDYILNRNWVLSLSYEHQELASTDRTLDHSFDKIMLGARLRY